MKKPTKIAAAIILVIILFVGGYFGYQKYKYYKITQASDKVMKDIGIRLNATDKAIVDEILKSNDLEYAYITHSGNTVMLTVKFKKGISDKDKSSKIKKYMDQVRAHYEGKNINVKTLS